MSEPTEQQLNALRARWEKNPASYRSLFKADGRAVPLPTLLRHFEERGMTHMQAIGQLATLTQLGKLRMISLDLLQLGAKPDPLPAWAEETED